jgi:hypothetical protein
MARDFTRAGELFHTHHPDTIAAPPFYLYCHAIELSLKSFLIVCGTTERHLRRIGHDLEAGLEAASSRGLGEVASLLAEEHAAIRVMNPYYRGKELEYLVTGFRSYPTLDLLQSCATKLVSAIEPYLRTQLARRPTSRCS